MSNADNIFWRQFGIILAILTIFGFVVAFIARSIAGDAHEAAMNTPMATAARIAPVGTVHVGDPSKMTAAAASPAPAASAQSESAPEPAAVAAAETASAPIDGEQIYNSACMACHATGAAGAPKMGDEAAWAPRFEQGLDALVNSAINGKGSMPPKGGHANLSDEQIRAAVQFLTGLGDASATEMATDGVKQMAAAASEAAQQVVEKATSMTGETVGAAAGAVSDAAASAVSAASAAATVSSVAAANEGKSGAEVYNMGCVACHATGAANAPKLDDKAAWQQRVATGFAALVQSVTNGKGAMPPRGGLSTLSDADVENAVRYMLKEAGVEAGG